MSMIEILPNTVLEIAAITIIACSTAFLLPWALIKAARRAGVSRAQLITVRRWLQALSLAFGTVAVVNALGLGSELELLSIGGIVALVFSLALQGFISSMIAGFLSFGKDTLRLGDLVEVASAGKGRIVKINLRNVWIKTDGGALLVIDHLRVEQGRLWNYSALERLEKQFDKRSSIA